MCWLFGCGDGWYFLVDKLCDSVQRYIDNNGKTQAEFIQIKEKFGLLRCYVDFDDDRIDGMIQLAETMSASICESCGTTKDVKQNKRGWIKYLCSVCRSRDEE